MKAVVATFNQEKALVGAFSVITNLRMEHFEALAATEHRHRGHQPGILINLLKLGAAQNMASFTLSRGGRDV